MARDSPGFTVGRCQTLSRAPARAEQARLVVASDNDCAALFAAEDEEIAVGLADGETSIAACPRSKISMAPENGLVSWPNRSPWRGQ